MSLDSNHAPEGLRGLADSIDPSVRFCRLGRNVLLGCGTLTEASIGVAALLGASYPTPSYSPYVVSGIAFLSTAGIAHWGIRHSQKMAEDFREAARDIEVLDTYTDPDAWEQ